MSEKEEIRRKLEEVDELRARIKELESNPVNWWWSPQNRGEAGKIALFAIVWVVLILVVSSTLQLSKMGDFYIVFLVIAAVAPGIVMEMISRRRR